MRILFVAASALASTIAQAATPIDGLYTSLFGGYTYLPNNINNTQSGLTRNDAVYEPGFDAGGSLGFKSNPMRYEGEITYLTADVKHFAINNIRQNNVSGYANGVFAMANVFYDVPTQVASLQPFLGVGLGYAWIHAELNSFEDNTTGQIRFAGSNSVFAYQGMAGITYNFAENYALNLGYRYVATERVGSLGKLFQAHMANLGAIYRFDGARYQ